MAVLNRIIPIVAACAALTGCYTDFDPHLDSEPMLCMNSLITAGDSLTVRLTRTWAWNEGHPGDDFNIDVTDAEVSLWVNDRFVETLEPVTLTDEFVYGNPFPEAYPAFRAPTYIPRPGDVVSLRAESADYGPASATATIPRRVPIDRVETTVKSFYEGSNYNGEAEYVMDLDLLVWLTDPGDATDYYKLDVGNTPFFRDPDYPSANEGVTRLWVDMTREPLFTEHVSALESVISDTSGYTVFSDRQIQGKSYPLHVSLTDLTYVYNNPTGRPDMGNTAIVLTLNAISEAYYRHVLSVWVANDGIVGSLGSVGLGEMVYTHSNVSTGAGVVAAATPVRAEVNLRQLVEQQHPDPDLRR